MIYSFVTSRASFTFRFLSPNPHVPPPTKKGQRLLCPGSTIINPTAVWRSRIAPTTRCHTYLSRLYRTLIATAFSAPLTSGHTEKNQRNVLCAPGQRSERSCSCASQSSPGERTRRFLSKSLVVCVLFPFFFPFFYGILNVTFKRYSRAKKTKRNLLSSYLTSWMRVFKNLWVAISAPFFTGNGKIKE